MAYIEMLAVIMTLFNPNLYRKKMKLIMFRLFLITLLILNQNLSFSQSFPLKFRKEFAFISFKKINNEVSVYNKMTGPYPSDLDYNNRYDKFNFDDIIFLNDHFKCEIKKNKEFIDLYYSDSIVCRLSPMSIYYSEKKDKFIIHGYDTIHKEIRVYFDKTKFKILNNSCQYRFQNDTLIFIPSDRTIGWGWFLPTYSINRYTDINLLTTDTVFVFPGITGPLANYTPISFDVIDGKWIFEGRGNVYVQNESMNTKYNRDIKHYTFIDKKEFFFYESDTIGYGIFYDGIDYGSLGYDKIIPITTSKLKIEFIVKKGIRYYKLYIIK